LPGLPGGQGLPGVTGPTGSQGLQGLTGLTGLTGSQGDPGPGTGIISGGSAGIVIGSGQFIGPFASPPDTTVGNVAFPVLTAGTLSHFIAKLQLAVGVGGSATFTVWKNGGPTGVTCTVPAGLTSKSCSDLAHTASFSPGDTVAVAITQTLAPTLSIVGWAAQYG
jgi:hypothetical protein